MTTEHSPNPRLLSLLQRFDQLQKQAPGPIPDSVMVGNTDQAPRLLLSCLIHGDETGPLPALVTYLENYLAGGVLFRGSITVILGNRRAALLGQRFTEQDLNRVFLSEAPNSFEKTRAAEIMPLVKAADLVLDFHQTIQPCAQSFYIFAFDPRTYYWSRLLGGPKVLVTRKLSKSFVPGCLSIDEYAVQQGIPAGTIELGQRGFSEASEHGTLEIVQRAVTLLHDMKDPADLATLQLRAESCPALKLYQPAHNERFTDAGMALDPGWRNFQPVAAGQVLGHMGNGQPLRAPSNGYLLFPKYPPRDDHGRARDPRPTDLYVILQEIEEADVR